MTDITGIQRNYIYEEHMKGDYEGADKENERYDGRKR